MSDDQFGARILFRSHNARATEAFRLLERCFYIRHADIKNGIADKAAATTHTAGDANACIGRTGIDETIIPSLRNGRRDRRSGVEFPAKQVAVITAQPDRVFSSDLKMNDRLCHTCSLSNNDKHMFYR